MNKWLEKYSNGDIVQQNYNDVSVSLPEGFVGMGYNTKGRNYSPAWGGQFEEGGALPKAQKGKIVVTNPNDPRLKAYQDSLSSYTNNNKFYDEVVPIIKNSTTLDELNTKKNALIKKYPIDMRIAQITPYNKAPIVGKFEDWYKMLRTIEFKKPVQPYILQKEPKLRGKQVTKAEPIKLDRTAFTPRLVGQQRPDVQLPTIQNLPYRVEYYDGDINGMTHKNFVDEKAGSEFMKELQNRSYGIPYGVQSYYENTPKKENGGWLEKYQGGGEEPLTKSSADWYKQWYEQRKTLPQFSRVAGERLNLLSTLPKVQLTPLEELQKFGAVGEYIKNRGDDASQDIISLADPTTVPAYAEKIGKSIDVNVGTDPSVVGHEMSHWFDARAKQSMFKPRNSKSESYEKYPFIKPSSFKKSGLDSKTYNWISGDDNPEVAAGVKTELNSVLNELRQKEGLRGDQSTTPEQLQKIIDKYMNLSEDDLRKSSPKGSQNQRIRTLIKYMGGDPEKLSELNNRIVSIQKEDVPIAKHGGLLNQYEVPKNQNAEYKLPSITKPREASESTANTFYNPLTKKIVNTATTGQTKENLEASTRAMGKTRKRDIEEEKQRVAERKSAVATKDKGKPFTLPTGETKAYKDMDWREKAYVSGKALENRGRFFENEESIIDDINPISWITDIAGGLGKAPLEARDYDSNLPYVAAILDPLIQGRMGFNPLGSAINTGKKIGSKVAQSMKSGVLSNAYKLNPFAENLNNPLKSYRVAGMDAARDFEATGVLRSNPTIVPTNLSEGILGTRTTSFPSFQKGYADLGYLPEEGGVVFETGLPTFKRGEINPVTGFPIKGRHYAHRVINPETGATMTKIPGENIRMFGDKPHWWKGYKEVEVPKTAQNFKSEINWGQWNKEIPEDIQLMKEYNAIEQTSKANGSWMKNPDGSPFQGTPEQFVQQNSENFKKAFGNSKLLNPDGSPWILEHGSPKKFNTFDESKFQLGDAGYSGSGIYTVPPKGSADSYTISGRRFHTGDIEPTTYKLYGQGNNPITSEELIKLGKNSPAGKEMDLFNFHRKSAPLNEQLLDYDVAIHNQNRGIARVRDLDDAWEVVFPTNKQLKSATGNNGMFDMTNPNIYKALVPATIGAAAITSQPEQKKEGGVIKDDMGYWNPENHGKVVEIDSPYITMEGVDQPLIGISDEGDQKYMLPGKNYKFKGKKVREYPVAKNGIRQEQKGLQNLDNLLNFTNYNKPQPGGWLEAYK